MPRAIPLRISKLKVSAWTGLLPDEIDHSTPPEEDFVNLINDDSVSGELLELKEDHVRLKTYYTTLDIPTERVSLISTSPRGRERARRVPHDVRIYLRNGGRITASLMQIDDRFVTAPSENTGELKLLLSAISRMEFNIYPRIEDVETIY